MGYTPPQGRGVSWTDVKSKLETAGNVAIVRGNLEYPTEDVSFAYLCAINKIEVISNTELQTRQGAGQSTVQT